MRASYPTLFTPLLLGRREVRNQVFLPAHSTHYGDRVENDRHTAYYAERARGGVLGRTAVPDDVAAGIRYFAGPESAWVTGQSLAIEGGNELRKAPSLARIARDRLGDDIVDTAMAGGIPGG